MLKCAAKILLIFRAEGGGSTEEAAREAAYRTLCTRLVPASKLSCLTEFFSFFCVNEFKLNYKALITPNQNMLDLDIFSCPDMNTLGSEVTEYAANYEYLTAELIRSLVPQNTDQDVRVECRQDTSMLWTSTVTIGIITIAYFKIAFLKNCNIILCLCPLSTAV